MDNLLVISGLKKKFGRIRALDGLSMAVPRNSVSALVGANGAGKSTTFALIGQFFRPKAGVIEIDGLELGRFRRQGGIIGILPQDVLFFESRSVERHLLLLAGLAGYRGAQARQEAARVLKLVDLEDRAGSTPAQLSHGMKVRFGVAQALVGRPPLVLLDEPTAGLDPKMTAQFRKVIDGLRGSATIIISSHDLSQLEMMCDYLCIIDRGKLVRQGPMQDFLSLGSRITVKLEKPLGTLAQLKKDLPEFDLSQPSPAALVVTFAPARFAVSEVNSRVLRCLFKDSIGVLSVESQRSLEETYLEETAKE